MVPPRSRGRGRRCPRLPCPCRDPQCWCQCQRLPNLGPTSAIPRPAAGSRTHRPPPPPSRYPSLLPKPTTSHPIPPPLPALPTRNPPLSLHSASASGSGTPAQPGAKPGRSSGLVRPSTFYRDTLLSSSVPLAPETRSRPAPDISLPIAPPCFLLNPSLRGRCYRCFGKGH